MRANQAGQEVALVGKAPAPTGDAEGLARAGPGPDGLALGPPGHAEGEGPAPDPGEGVELTDPGEVDGAEVADVAPVDGAPGEVAGGDEVPEPLGGVGIPLVVEHHPPSSFTQAMKARVRGGRPLRL